jgi:hypothetical protein
MRVSVQTPVSAVALASAAILAASVASAANSPERCQQYRPKNAAGENREPCEAGAVKACPAADPPPAGAAASQGGDINKLREAAQ